MRRLSAVLSLLLFASVAAAAPANPGGEPRTRHAVLTPARALTDADRAELAAEGIEVGAPLANGRHIVRIANDAVLDDARIVSIDAIRPQQKIQTSAYREFAMGRTMARVNVVFHKDVDYATARAAILAAGGVLDPLRTHFSPSQRVEVKVPSAALEALAADDNVVAIAGVRKLKVQSDNAVSAQVSHVTELYSAPYNLSGAGVSVSLFELAEGQASHVEFGGRLTVNATGGATSDKQHATHVAGTIGASGIRADAKGMAPNAKIYQFCIQTPCGDELTFLDDKEDKLAPLGVIADNNSWGFVLGWNEQDGEQVWNDADIFYGAYDLYFTSPIDEISNDKNILFVHSAGNDADPPVFPDVWSSHRHVDNDGDVDKTKLYCYSQNGSGSDCPATCTGGCETVKHHDTLPYDTIGVTASAKNVVTVGAVSQSGEIVDFSSRGPAKDGRLKPDLVARGSNVLSTIPTNAYGRASGTSMSTPVVTGIAAMLTEQWRKTFGVDPKPVQLKAILIAGTTDLGSVGPDYTYGYGLANAKNAADIIIADAAEGNRIRNLTFANGQGQTQEFRIAVSGTQNVRVVLQWNDPAIIPSPTDDEIADPALVNNLDLRVVGPDNTTYFPWVLDKNAPTASATKGVNMLDNTEVVDIPNAATGLYRVIVAGTRVTEGPQTAVVVTSAPIGITIASQCSDSQEPNNDVATAYGNLTGGSSISGGICSDGDVDFFKFVATKTGPVSVTVTARDTPLRVTLTGTGISRTQDIAANSTATLNADVNTVPNAITLKIEAIGARGSSPTYLFTPTFGVENGERRRGVRH